MNVNLCDRMEDVKYAEMMEKTRKTTNNGRILSFICACLLLFFCVPHALGESDVTKQSALPQIYLEGALLSTVENKPGKLMVRDGQEEFACDITLKYRGTYSASFTLKRNYTLHLKNATGGQLKHSLLHLREDDDWALLGGYSDPSRLRILVGLDLFRDACGPAPRGKLCEVHFGQYYKGIYTLVERPDRKSAGVPRDGALYRVLAAGVDGVDILSAPATDAPAGESWHNIGKEYPEGDDGWQAMERLHAFLTTADEGEFAEKVGAYLDLPAFADYYLFVNLTGASDNMQKNLFLAWDKDKFYPMIWDMDAAFGRLYNAEFSDPAVWYSSPLFDRLMQTEAFAALVRERYATLREMFLPESVCARFEQYAQQLEESGALMREAERFSTYTDITTQKTHPLNVRGEIELIRDFMQKRVDLLDEAFLY